MGPAEASGGLPWGYALGAFGAMGAAIGALWRSRGAASKSYGKLLREKDALIAAKDAALAACERKADSLDQEMKDFLTTLLDQKYARLRGGVYRPTEPPAGVKRKDRTTRDLAREAAEVLTAEGLDMTGTMH